MTGAPDDFNTGLMTAGDIVLRTAESLAGTGGAAVGEMPQSIPASTLETLYNTIMAAQKGATA